MIVFWLALGAASLLAAAGYALPKLLPLVFTARDQRDRYRYVMAYRTRAIEALQHDNQRIDHASVVNAANELYAASKVKPTGLEDATL